MYRCITPHTMDKADLCHEHRPEEKFPSATSKSPYSPTPFTISPCSKMFKISMTSIADLVPAEQIIDIGRQAHMQVTFYISYVRCTCDVCQIQEQIQV